METYMSSTAQCTEAVTHRLVTTKESAPVHSLPVFQRFRTVTGLPSALEIIVQCCCCFCVAGLPLNPPSSTRTNTLKPQQFGWRGREESCVRTHLLVTVIFGIISFRFCIPGHRWSELLWFTGM